MNLKCKKNLVFKISALLAIIILSLSLTFGSTFARYMTEIARDVVFSPKTDAAIYLNSNKAPDRTLIAPEQWQMGVNQMSSTLTLSNAAPDSTEPAQQDIAFRIRVYLADDSSQEQITAPEITLSVDGAVCPSKIQALNDKTDFYKQNQKKGKFYCFFDSVQADISSELEFVLLGKQNSQLTFTLIVYDTQISTEQIFVCVERIK